MTGNRHRESVEKNFSLEYSPPNDLLSYRRIEVAANVKVLPKAGYFIMSSPELKINRITTAEKPFIDAAKQVKPEPMLIAKCR